MPTNVLQKNQSYPELGYRIDGKGIAYDLQTGQSLSRQDVDARIAQAENVDPTSNDYAERERHRGGLAGVYDRNKKVINPIAELGLGLINPALAAAYGAAVGGFDKEGQGGIKLDPLGAAKGGASGYLLGKMGGALGDAGKAAMGAGSIGGAAKAAGGSLLGSAGLKTGGDGTQVSDITQDTPGVQNASISHSSPSLVSQLGSKAADLLGGGGGGSGGLTAADWLKAAGGAIGAGVNYKSGQDALKQRANEFNRTTGNSEMQVAANTQQLLNRAPMADQAQALLRARMGQAPTTFAPRDYTRTGLTPQTMGAPATGGPQDALAAARTAAANYQPGQGGVDTSVLDMLKRRMLSNAGMKV